jgi:hypothetical protein
MPDSVTFCGRTFRSHELELMRQITAQCSALGVTEIARTVCELLEWKRPNGGLKNHECRQLLEQLATEGALTLPELRRLGGRGPRRIDVSAPCFEPEPVECAVNECAQLQLILVEGKAESCLWREQMERYHDWENRYGHRPLLLETLVDAARFRGTCYRAANWIYVGQTTGRCRSDREHKNHSQSIKDIYLYPLIRDVRQYLCGDPTR